MRNALLALALLSTPAYAADFSKPLYDAEGKVLCTRPLEEGKTCSEVDVATLGRVSRAALYASFEDERTLSADEKLKRADLAAALVGVAETKLKAEDIVLIKKVVGKAYGPLIVWAVFHELEGDKDAK